MSHPVNYSSPRMEISRKRLLETNGPTADSPVLPTEVSAKKRKSRFASLQTDEVEQQQPLQSSLSSTSVLSVSKNEELQFLGDNNVESTQIFTASEKAAQISRELQSKLASTSSHLIPSAAYLRMKLQEAALIKERIAAQIASVSSILLNAGSAIASTTDKRASYRPLLLDNQGRQVDEFGNVVQLDLPTKLLAANSSSKLTKVVNPYLSHKDPDSTNDNLQPSHRDFKAKKALKFVEAGNMMS